jgi:nitrogen fixation protein FixH
MTAIPIREVTGRHVLIAVLAFFGVMLAVNAVFVVFALSTFNGGEGGRAYQRGLDYNEVIAAARAQEALGWSHRLEVARAGQVSLSLSDRNGAPVAGLVLDAEIARPVADRFTRALAFREVAPGAYAADLAGLEPGNWVVSLAASRRGGPDRSIIYRAKERLWLKPNS